MIFNVLALNALHKTSKIISLKTKARGMIYVRQPRGLWFVQPNIRLVLRRMSTVIAMNRFTPGAIAHIWPMLFIKTWGVF